MVDVPTDTLPKARLGALTVSVGTPAFNCRAKVSAMVPALAVKVAVCVVVTPETVAEKPALAEPAATVTVEGTVTAELLLARFTVNPPVAAAAFSVTVQGSVPEPVIEPSVHERPARTGMPVPLRLTAFEDEESLAIMSCPVTAPATAGSNCTVNVAREPGFKVTGRVGVDTVKPVPEMVAELMVTEAAPVEVKVSVCDIRLFTDTLPKARLPALRVSAGFATSTSTLALSETPPAVAVSVTCCDVLTAEAVAWNPTLVAPAATVTEAGTVRAELLLTRFTVTPPLAAAEFKLTEQESDANSTIELLPHVSEVRTGVSVGSPVPSRPMTVMGSVPALLVTVSFPVALPDRTGLNTTLTLRLPPPPARVTGRVL